MTPDPARRRTSRVAPSWLALLALVGGAAPAAQPKAAGPAASAPRAMVVGWDGADWKLLDVLVSQGRLPNLARLLARGRSWNLETYEPMASPLIWTTLATGRNPIDHGVADFQETDPKSRLKIPVSGRSRKVPALWNVASWRGLSVGVVGWWATWPAERVDGFLVSDRAAPVLFDLESLARSPALTWPEGLAEGVRIVGRREGTPGFAAVAKLLAVSRADFEAAVAAKRDLGDPVTGTQKILGSTRVYARAALDLYDRQKPRLTMVYFQGTDEIGHVLARYRPPRLPDVSEADFRKYSDGVASFYAEADRILGEFAKRAEADGATLWLVSDHGFKWGKDRPAIVPSIRFDTAYLWHESPGVLAGAGPGIVPARARGRATVFDVVPTLCRLLGLPPDPAFEGKPVAGLDARRLPPAAPPVSWAKAVPVERLVVSAEAAGDRQAAEEFQKKLIALGYLTGSEAAAVDARPPDRAGTETSGSFQNLGTYLRKRGKVAESIPWYRRALEVNPTSPPAWMNLSQALFDLGRWDESDEALVESLKGGAYDPEAAVDSRAASYARRAERNKRAGAQRLSFLRRVALALPGNDRYRLWLGRGLFEAGDCAAAESIVRDLVARKPSDTEPLNLNALCAVCLGKTGEAKALFSRSLALDPRQEKIRQVLLQLER